MVLKRDKENQNIEWKSSWQDKYLKWVCGMANANGGEIYIGFNDKGILEGINNAKNLVLNIPKKITNTMGLISRVEILEEDKKEYLKISIGSYNSPISYKGKYYLRSGSNNLEVTGVELTEFMLKKVGKTWDGFPYPNITVDDLDISAFRRFRQKARSSKRLSEEDLQISDKELLRRLDLYEGDFLTVAAVLLFHEEPTRYFTGASIKIGYFVENGAEIKYQDEIGGPLIKQVDEAIDKIYTKYLKGLIWYNGIYREEEFMFPREAFRELLLNSVNHKPYYRGIPIQIKIFDDKIYIFNNCKFPKELNPKKMYKAHSSYPYNPKIASAFFRAGFIESWGRGFEKIKRECDEGNVPYPTIEVLGDGITIMCTPSKKYLELSAQYSDNVPNNVPNNVPDNAPNVPNKIEERLNKILILVEKNKKISIEELAKILAVDAKTIKRSINILKTQNRLIRIGSPRAGYWEVKE